LDLRLIQRLLNVNIFVAAYPRPPGSVPAALAPMLRIASSLWPQNLRAQADTAKVGIFILSIYNLDLNDRSFSTDFWLWVNHKMDSISFENSIEIPNAKETTYSMFMSEVKGDGYWVTEKCHSVVKAEWDILDFPFDK